MKIYQIGNVVIFPKMSDLDNSVVMLRVKKNMLGYDVKVKNLNKSK